MMEEGKAVYPLPGETLNSAPANPFVLFGKRSNNDTGLVTHLFMMRPSLHFAFLQVHRI